MSSKIFEVFAGKRVVVTGGLGPTNDDLTRAVASEYFQKELIFNKKEEVIELMNAIMKEKNKELASYESIKKIRILEEDLDQDKDELTPTLKVKRKVVTEHYNALLEGMYS